jgi:hypothetical protein
MYIYAEELKLGWPASDDRKKTSDVVINGNLKINATSDNQMVIFPAPNRIQVSESETLEAYIARVMAGSGADITVTAVANSANFATDAIRLVSQKGASGVNKGDLKTPVYFSGGEPVVCTGVASQEWVNNKNYLTSSALSGYAT